MQQLDDDASGREFVTIPELARLVRRNRKTVYIWINDGQIGEADGLFAVLERTLIHWPTFRARQFKPRERLRGRLPDYDEEVTDGLLGKGPTRPAASRALETTVVRRPCFNGCMKEAITHQSERAALLVQNFHTSDIDDLFLNVFRMETARGGFRYVRQAHWKSDKAFAAAMAVDYLRPQDEVLADMRDECDLRLTVKRGGNVIQLFACAKFRAVHVLVAGRDSQSAAARIREHRALFEGCAREGAPARPRAPFGFWYLSEKGPEREEKELAVPAWHEIKDNYSGKTSQALGALISGFKPGAGGRLLLWHGEPGTGKTFAIRALAWEWRGWCQFEYVLDPENLFGARADYLGHLVIGGMEPEDNESDARWRILVLEDTGELLSIDAKERAGQGLSRLLNAVDGLLGQGSRVLLLITTNEELGVLHPAVTRPGRCASQIEFLPLTPTEAQTWLGARTASSGALAPKGPMTIAQLYARLEGRLVLERPSIGFAGGA